MIRRIKLNQANVGLLHALMLYIQLFNTNHIVLRMQLVTTIYST